MSIEAQRLLIDMYNAAHEMDVTTCFKDNGKRERFLKAREMAGEFIRSARAATDGYDTKRVTLSNTGAFMNEPPLTDKEHKDLVLLAKAMDAPVIFGDIYDHSDMD